MPKWRQRASTRSAEARSTSTTSASSWRRWRRVRWKRTDSPGSAPSTNTALPPDVSDAAPFVIQRLDLGGLDRGSLLQARAQALSYWRQCGSARSASHARTRAVSAAYSGGCKRPRTSWNRSQTR